MSWEEKGSVAIQIKKFYWKLSFSDLLSAFVSWLFLSKNKPLELELWIFVFSLLMKITFVDFSITWNIYEGSQDKEIIQKQCLLAQVLLSRAWELECGNVFHTVFYNVFV